MCFRCQYQTGRGVERVMGEEREKERERVIEDVREEGMG